VHEGGRLAADRATKLEPVVDNEAIERVVEAEYRGDDVTGAGERLLIIFNDQLANCLRVLRPLVNVLRHLQYTTVAWLYQTD